MKYKEGDKVVVELDQDDAICLRNDRTLDCINEEQIIGKLEDFTKPKKIKFSEAEKKEFDWLADRFAPYDIFDILNDIKKDSACSLPNLHNRLFKNYTVSDDAEKQFEFIKAIENPSLIQAEKEKKYRLKILGGYIAYDSLMNTYDFWKNIVNKPRIYHFSFTQSQIDKMQKLPKFQAIDLNKFKEEAKDE